ncbi:MAG: putative competence-damaged protein CinA like protein [Betaproteobacteria bacterium]|jgi:PncC family amidohydrolase|nr:putative competence-damaged protein CinA like protein [Betaproteobacteria bacterium]
MRELMPYAEKAGALLKTRKQTVAVAESSAGGLIAAALLAVPGASAYFVGGAVLYTRISWRALRQFRDEQFEGTTPATEINAQLRARIIRVEFGADWGIGETGAAGPTGGRYGNPAGLACIAIAGDVERAATVQTGSSDRFANMHAFAAGALQLLAQSLE